MVRTPDQTPIARRSAATRARPASDFQVDVWSLHIGRLETSASLSGKASGTGSPTKMGVPGAWFFEALARRVYHLFRKMLGAALKGRRA
jgi:hypothetical protein